MILIANKEERELVKRLRELGNDGASQVCTLTSEVTKLKREIADLEIEKSKRQEGFEKSERELRHMVGLERQRQEAERERHKVEVNQASQAASLDVREKNLAADEKRFAEQLAFNTERFTTMEKYLKDMMGDILQRLPNVTMQITKTS